MAVDLEAASSTEHSVRISSVAAALQVLLILCGIALALFVNMCQSIWPSRQELAVIDAIEGRTLGAITLQPNDYVEWTISRCFGDCAAYRVRLDRWGEVMFDGEANTCRRGVHRRRIEARQAEAVLVAVEVALREPVSAPWIIDASSLSLTARVSGQSRRLELPGLTDDVTQAPVRRLLDASQPILLDPGWLPVWTPSGATCVGLNGGRIPFDPRSMEPPT